MKNLYIIFVAIAFVSCDNIFFEEEFPDNAVSNFEYFWKEYDAKYGLFQVKNIDWDSVYSVYRPQISETSTDEELYSVLVGMLELLNDNHIALAPTSDSDLPYYRSGILGKLGTINDFDLEILKNSYFTTTKFEDPFFTYGILPGNIGYIHIEGFSDMPRYIEKPMDNILSELKDTKAIIIDARGGYGGEDLMGKYIAGRFATEKTLYQKSRIKNGAGENDFTEWEEWYVEPEGDFQYSNPVVVLTHRFTLSARETFCLAMKVLPQVTFVGDTTAGSFSNQINRELPNGWGYSISIGQWVDANGTSYEGLGLVPDIVIQNKKQDVLNGKDEVLEKAMEILN